MPEISWDVHHSALIWTYVQTHDLDLRKLDRVDPVALSADSISANQDVEEIGVLIYSRERIA